ncbi:MAG TPA: SRPBCC domain-containing protein [Micromonosporaceae bacterium]
MGREFRVSRSAEVDASVAEVWDAIATGPGIDAWFMGRTEVADGHVRTVFGDYTPDATVTAEDGTRFAYETPPAPDGRFVAYDFLVEARDGGGATLRLVTSGFLPGDDWTDEFEAMNSGGELFFATLVEYLSHFAGRVATPLLATGPLADGTVWASIGTALGRSRAARTGDAVTLHRPDGSTVDGTVYLANDDTLGVRTTDAMYRFVRGLHGPLLAMHVLFAGVEDPAAWSEWMSSVAATARP